MKKLFTFLLATTLSATVFGQDPIKNFSFENWITDADTNEVPADWDYDKEAVEKGVLKKHNSGTHGNSALYLGKYEEFPSVYKGAEVSIEGNLTSIPNYFIFDYINYYEGNISRLVVHLFFYDDNKNTIEDYFFTEPLDNSTFKRETTIIDTSKIANAKSYKIEIYTSPNGTLNDYAIVDNVRFSQYPGSAISVREINTPTINLYPNPTTGVFNYSFEENETLSKIIVTGIDGKQTVVKPSFTNTIDISALSTGVYTVSFINEQKVIVGRNKVVLTK